MNTFLAALVAYDKASNSVSWAPGPMVEQLVNGIAAVVGAVSALVIVWYVVRKLFGLVKGPEKGAAYTSFEEELWCSPDWSIKEQDGGDTLFVNRRTGEEHWHRSDD